MQAFTELQQKMIESNQKIKFSEAQIEGLKRSVLHKQLTEKEMTVKLKIAIFEIVYMM